MIGVVQTLYYRAGPRVAKLQNELTSRKLWWRIFLEDFSKFRYTSDSEWKEYANRLKMLPSTTAWRIAMIAIASEIPNRNVWSSDSERIREDLALLTWHPHGSLLKGSLSIAIDSIGCWVNAIDRRAAYCQYSLARSFYTQFHLYQRRQKIFKFSLFIWLFRRWRKMLLFMDCQSRIKNFFSGLSSVFLFSFLWVSREFSGKRIQNFEFNENPVKAFNWCRLYQIVEQVERAESCQTELRMWI